MTIQVARDLQQFDTNISSIHIVGGQRAETNTSQVSSHTSINNPFPYMESDVWEWFLVRGRYRSARSLGEATRQVAETFGIPQGQLRIHFSYDGAQRYAIVVRIPVHGTAGQRFEVMGDVEDAFYGSLRESVDSAEAFERLRADVSLAFLPG